MTKQGKGAFVVQDVDSFVELHIFATESQHHLTIQQQLEEYAQDAFRPPVIQ